MSRLRDILDGRRPTHLPPRLTPIRLQHAQERRRTSGQVRSIEDRFIIDPEAKTLEVYDDSDFLRVRLGDLGGNDYGLQLYDAAGSILFDYDTTGGFSGVPALLFYDQAKLIGGAFVQNDIVMETADLLMYQGVVGSTNYLTLTGDGVDATIQLVNEHPTLTGELDLVATDVRLTATNLGFNVTPVAFPISVTGSRGSNAALASALTALASLGLITDNTTA